MPGAPRSRIRSTTSWNKWKLVVIGMLARSCGLDGKKGISLIAAYLMFVAFRIYLA